MIKNENIVHCSHDILTADNKIYFFQILILLNLIMPSHIVATGKPRH